MPYVGPMRARSSRAGKVPLFGAAGLGSGRALMTAEAAGSGPGDSSPGPRRQTSATVQRDEQAGNANEVGNPEGEHPADQVRADGGQLPAKLHPQCGKPGLQPGIELSQPLLQLRVESGEVPGPRILTTGNPIFPANGTPIYVRDLWKRRGWASDEVETPELARAKVAAQLRRGADGVKVFTGAIVGPPQGVMLTIEFAEPNNTARISGFMPRRR